MKLSLRLHAKVVRNKTVSILAVLGLLAIETSGPLRNLPKGSWPFHRSTAMANPYSTMLDHIWIGMLPLCLLQ